MILLECLASCDFCCCCCFLPVCSPVKLWTLGSPGEPCLRVPCCSRSDPAHTRSPRNQAYTNSISLCPTFGRGA